MIRKLPIAAVPISLRGAMTLKPADEKAFGKALASYLGLKGIYLFDSGISSFYMVLKALTDLDGRSEVVLPAFTAGSLIVGIRKAGLKAVLCDISLNDFNMDASLAAQLVGKNTLAVLGIHMFGIINAAFAGMKKAFPEVYMIEDCAQAQGSLIGGKHVGSMGDASFFSFNKGKNMPLCKGGCIATGNERIAAYIEKEIKNEKTGNRPLQFSLRARMALLSMLADPVIYGLTYAMTDTLKEKKPPRDLEVGGFSRLQAGYGLFLLKNMDELAERRYKNGMRLIDGLSGLDGLILPKISVYTRPAFNRLPVVFNDPERKEAVRKALWKAGIEVYSLYPEPLHHMFDLGYARSEFPNATFIAENSWTFPVHQGVSGEDVDKMIETVRKAL